MQTRKVSRAIVGQANEIGEMVGNRAAVLGVDDGPRARSGERGDNLSDGLGMMAFGREFKSAFPGGGG